MNQIMNYLFLSCDKASELIDKKAVYGLKLKERISLSIHTTVCSICRKYKKKNEVLEHILDRFLHSEHRMAHKHSNS
jgi:hypothetical protein